MLTKPPTPDTLSNKSRRSFHGPELEGLYFVLLASRFAFVRETTASIVDIYEAVRREHADLCVDVPCRRDGRERPDEWKHQVRRALHRLSAWGMIERGHAKGEWKLAASSKV